MRNNALLIFILLFISCAKNPCEQYVLDALKIIESNSIMIDEVNWKRIQSEALNEAQNKQSVSEAYGIIRHVLKELGDHHSSFMTASQKEKITTNNNRKIEIQHRLLENNLGYLRVPSFTGNDSLSLLFSEAIIEKIKLLDTSGATHWIIDVRDNTGGNMWSMLLGLSPLIEEGTAGYFVRKNDTVNWSVKNGTVLNGNNVRLKLTKPYQFNNKPEKIAVLVNSKTCSSAEAVTISLKGRRNVKVFGTDTCGLTSGNSIFQMSDGSLLILTTTVFADRNKTYLVGK